ncbi:hypothetical protein FSP39_008420 [Pinctada imbricata]|uniref:Uncharacterized protein n=1 Tax=Pinctada imbricata TaxID=66713 RepID=A0AA89C555_PINIB|nr:hypothetical protein FSP39_008420 [Pinctada imbricata]
MEVRKNGLYKDEQAVTVVSMAMKRSGMELLDVVKEFFSLQTVAVGFFIGLLTYQLYNKLKYKSPPGPWSLPLIGNYKRKCPSKAVFLNSLDVVIEAMVKKKSDFADRPRTKSGDMFSDGGKGIAFSPYSATWKFQKKVAGKALRYYMLGSRLEDMVNDVCGKIFERMSQEKEPFYVNEYTGKIVIHVLFNMCFGQKCDLDSKDVARILKLDEEIVERFNSGFIEDLIPGITYVYKTMKWRELEDLADELLTFIRKEVQKHKDTFEESNIRDYTDSILMARAEAETQERVEDVAMLTDVYIVQIIADIFLGGLETTMMTLDWFMAFMVAFPEYQEQCQAEIDQALGKGKSPSASDRNNLCFTEACMMETMRKGSVAAIGIPHYTICDSSVGGFDIPKGTMVFNNYWALHNDSNFWKDVDKFDPYRYLTKDGKMDMKPESWLPFSAGRRVCLGEPVARTELLLIAANMLQNFNFKTSSGVKHKVTTKFNAPGNELPEPHKVIIEKRN